MRKTWVGVDKHFFLFVFVVVGGSFDDFFLFVGTDSCTSSIRCDGHCHICVRSDGMIVVGSSSLHHPLAISNVGSHRGRRAAHPASSIAEYFPARETVVVIVADAASVRTKDCWLVSMKWKAGRTQRGPPPDELADSASNSRVHCQALGWIVKAGWCISCSWMSKAKPSEAYKMNERNEHIIGRKSRSKSKSDILSSGTQFASTTVSLFLPSFALQAHHIVTTINTAHQLYNI
jgi:hypothetical protein